MFLTSAFSIFPWSIPVCTVTFITLMVHLVWFAYAGGVNNDPAKSSGLYNYLWYTRRFGYVGKPVGVSENCY